jgi:hypothetical protein
VIVWCRAVPGVLGAAASMASAVRHLERSPSLQAAAPGTAAAPPLPAGRRLSLALILGSLSALGALSIDMYLPASS